MAQAKTVNVNFKLDSEVKKKMEQSCSDMGSSMSAAFTIFAKKLDGKEDDNDEYISIYNYFFCGNNGV